MQPIISVKNVTKKFKEVVAVDDISFDVNAGEIFAFLGPRCSKAATPLLYINIFRLRLLRRSPFATTPNSRLITIFDDPNPDSWEGIAVKLASINLLPNF